LKKRLLTGLIIGLTAGVIDVIPMIIMKLPSQADISAFCMWVVVGVLLGTTELKLHGVLKGMLLSILVLLPSFIIIAWEEPLSQIHIIIITLVLGSLAGLFYHIMTNSKIQ
jgi:hypothetical protein